MAAGVISLSGLGTNPAASSCLLLTPILCVYAVGMSVLAVLAFENGYSKLFKFASGFSQSRKLPRLQSTLEFCHPSHGCRQTVGHFQIAESCVIWQVAKSIMQNLGKQR